MFKWLASDKAGAVLDKVFFLEPVPVIFRVLQHNLRSVPKAIGLNIAVANASGVLNMYCLGIAGDLGTAPGGQLAGSSMLAPTGQKLPGRHMKQAVAPVAF